MTLSPNILSLYSATTNYTIYGISWIPSSARVLSVGMAPRGTGIISVWNFEEQKLVEQSRHEKQAALKCVTFGASLAPARCFATGDHSGNLFEFNVERLQEATWAAKAHDAMIHCVDGIGGRSPNSTGAPEVASGGADGFVKLWDFRQKDPVMSLGPSEQSITKLQIDKDKYIKQQPECWTVALGGASSTTERLLACGYDSGDFKLIDLRMMKVCYEHHFPNGVVSSEFDRAEQKLNCIRLGTLEGHIYSLDLSGSLENPAIVDHKQEDACTVWQVRHSPFNRDVFVASAGSKLYLNKYEYPAQRVIENKTVPGNVVQKADAMIGTQTSPSIGWSREKNGLLAWGSMDQTVNVGFVTNMKTLE